MKFSFAPATLWFGSDDSYEASVVAAEQLRALEAAGIEAVKATIQMRGGGKGSDPFELPPLWNLEGDTAVVNIDGSLVSGSAGFGRLFGVIGYEDVKQALAQALESKDAKRIVLNIDSGGGAVNGVQDAGNFIQSVGKVKPVVAYTDGSMLSAAYWLGVSANKLYSSQTGQTGSVGTISVVTEYSKALEKEGITKKVIRHGKFKAMGNQWEPLTKAGEEMIQGLVNESGNIFVDYAATRRGVTAADFQKTMGEGRVLMGRQATEVGLIDGVMSLQDLLGSAKVLDSANSTAQNSRHSAKGLDMKIRAISKAVILALLGGTKVEALGLSEPVANVEGTKPEAEDLVALQAEATEIQSAFAAATTKAVEAAVATAKADSDKVVVAATAETAGLKAKVTLLEAGATELTGKVTAAAELSATYAGVVKASITQMATALGVADTGATLTGKELMAEHGRLEGLFKEKFKVGGVAAVLGASTKPGEGKQTPSPEFLALVARK